MQLNRNKKVSIIIPVYNSESHISQTIESILSQEYTHLEIIIVDDGSTDSTKKIIQKYENQDIRLKYFYQKNSGAPSARNYGFKQSSGEYIIFLDADDLMSPIAINKFMEEVGSDNLDLLIANYKHIVNDIVMQDSARDFSKFTTSNKNMNEENNNYFLRKISFLDPVPGNKMFKRTFLINNKLEYKNLKIGQDLNYYLNVVSNYPTVKIIEDIVFYYRIHEGSISTSYNSSIQDIVHSLEHVANQKSIFYSENIDVLNTLKLNHYTSQLIKVPKIKNKQIRKDTFNVLKNALDRVNKNIIKDELIKYYGILKIVTHFKSLYTSNLFSKIFIKFKYVKDSIKR